MRDGGGGGTETTQGPGDPIRQDEPQHGGARRRGNGDHDERHRGLALDLLGPRATGGSLTATVAGAGPIVGRLQLREASTDDRGGGDRDHGRGDEGDQGERQRETDPEAHGRAAR